MASKKLSRQQGVALLIFVLVLVMTSALALGTWGRDYAQEMRHARQGEAHGALETVRDRLLTFAMFSPEIYVSDSSGSPSGTREQHRVPPPGYLPCPDTDGDGSPQSGCTGIAYGCLPVRIDSRHVGFLADDAARALTRSSDCASHPYYVVDADFAVKTTFSPLDPAMTPDIQLDGQPHVALLILPGRDGAFEPENLDGDDEFTRSGDQVVGIEASVWQEAVTRRVENLYQSYLTLKSATGQTVSGPFWLCSSGGGTGMFAMFTSIFSFDWGAFLDLGSDEICG